LFSVRFSLHHETHISAQPHQKKTNPRISGPHGDSWRPHDSETPPGEASRRVVTVDFPIDCGVDETVRGATTSRRLFRLLKAAEFDRVFQQSQRSADDFFTVLYRSNDLDRPRLGLAIAKKRVPLAVGRNRLKRIIRESFRGAEQQLKGLDIVIMARQKAGAARNDELFASLDRHWQSLNKRAKH
jgi:ribonuclease P protein component